MHIIAALIVAVMTVGAFYILFYIFWFVMLLAKTYPAGRCPFWEKCGNFKSWSCVCNSKNGAWHGDYDHKCFKKVGR